MAFLSVQFPERTKGRRLAENEFNIHNNKKMQYILLNSSITATLTEKNFIRMDVRQDDITGEIGLFFNTEEGLKLSIQGANKGNGNFICHNKQVVRWLCSELNLTDKVTTLRLSENLSRHPDGMFYKIIGITR